MPADDDYGATSTRRQLLLHHAAVVAAAGAGAPAQPPPQQQAAASAANTTTAATTTTTAAAAAATAPQQQAGAVPTAAAPAVVPQPVGASAVAGGAAAAERYHAVTACPAGCPVAPDRLQATSQERLSERGSISSGSERLHPCYQPTTATERLDRFTTTTPDRFAPEKIDPSDRLHARDDRFPTAAVDRIPPADRYQPATQADRYTPTPDRHLTTERLQTSGHCPDRYRFTQTERYAQNIGSLDRYGSLGPNAAERYQTVDKFTNVHSDERSTSSDRSLERYTPADRFTTPERGDCYQQTINRSNQSAGNQVYNERFSGRYHQDRFQPGAEYQQERFNCERYPALPVPERFVTQQDRNFASQERIAYGQVPYIPPPSPAPASDRFIPPPPLSPTNTPSPDCYPSNPFPSPTTAAPPERFIPPPPLSPSPTEKFSPKPDRFTDKRYQDRYAVSPSPDRYSYHHPDRYPDRYQCFATTERYTHPQFLHQTDRYGTTERYLPPSAHTPVERYVPQPQEQYYQPYQTYERYPKWNNSTGDPYMRRDLGYHHHYRLLAPPYQPHQPNQPHQPLQYPRPRYGTPNRVKCCAQYQETYQLSKSSPGSTSSSSSVASQGKDIQSYTPKELQCYHQADIIQAAAFHQEKAIQCASFQPKDLQCVGFPSPAVRAGKVPCKHVCSSPGVEYVGQSGGRHVCATPPPPRAAAGAGEPHCGEQCCLRRPAATTLHTAAVWRATGHHPTNGTNPSPSPTNQQPQPEEQPSPPVENPPTKTSTIPTVQRAISLPAPSISDRYQQPEPARRIDYSQSERIPNRERPKFARSASRKEAVKNYIKRETANFFGVDEETEVDQQQRWLDRRKRLASRTYGVLKDEYQAPSGRTLRRQATISYGTTAAVIGSGLPGTGEIGETVQELPRAYAGDRPDVLPTPSDVPDAPEERYPDATVRRKDSVARMTWDGISYVVNTLTKHRPRPRSTVRQWSRSYPPEEGPSDILEDDVFFERPTTPTSPSAPDTGDAPDAPLEPRPQQPARYSTRSGAPAWRRDTISSRRDQARPEIGGSRIWSAMLDSVLDNSDRRQYGMGWVGKMFGRSMRSSVARDEQVKQQLDDLEDYRPLFTYWVTTVQVLVLAISLICYGFGPAGIDLYQRSGQVLVTSLSLQQVEYKEPANFWLGPRAADLIHLGAKFAPCMRVDNKIMKEIEKTREKERETACCIRNDDSGCVQSSQADCSKTISTWKKWSAGDSGPGGRISGSVCGLDPKFCDAPASVHPYEWPDDITKWPICRKTNSFTQRRGGGGGGSTSIGTSARDKLAEHMVCEVIGHPCCIGIHGECRITTREYCDFVRGHFHEEASLCAQVSCLDDVCGMVPFYFAETPDQFYRLWTSMYLHAGVLQLIVTVLIQHFLMRDLEKLTGPLRIGIIYIGSGVAGNLASSIFVPYRADVGPAGSQFGLLACLVVEVLNSWPMLKHPHHALFKLLLITFVLLLFGLLPWVDNYSHIFGFVFGFLLSYALLPFVSFGPYDRQRKIVLIWVCLTSAGVLFISLVLLFYIIPVYDCEICSYFNCVPWTRDFCASQNINFMRQEPVV